MSLNTWLVKSVQYVLSAFELILSLSWRLQVDGLLCLFLRVGSRWLCSAIYALDSAKYVCCKGPAALSSVSSVTKKCPDVTSNARIPSIA